MMPAMLGVPVTVPMAMPVRVRVAVPVGMTVRMPVRDAVLQPRPWPVWGAMRPRVGAHRR